MPNDDLTNLVRDFSLERWPTELWQALAELVRQAHDPDRKTPPAVLIKGQKYADYLFRLSETRQVFNQGLLEMEKAGLIAFKRQPNSSLVATRVWAQENSVEILEALITEFSPLEQGKRQKDAQRSQLIRELARVAITTYGPMGLRTLSHLILGRAHDLDWCTAPETLGLGPNELWIQSDPITYGASIVRIAGRLSLHTPSAVFEDRWERPGHYLWPWEIEVARVKALGKRLILIENIYPFWEMMSRQQGENITLICFHGEWRLFVGRTSPLVQFLQKIYTHFPGLETLIWCDPDPGGLRMATVAYDLVVELGGQPHFWRMEDQVLAQLETLVLAEPKLQPLEEPDSNGLDTTKIHPELHPLLNEIVQRKQKGEQEALVYIKRDEGI